MMLNPQLTSLVITEEGLKCIQHLLTELHRETCAKSIILIEKSGQHLANVGEETPHLMAISALVVGAFASTREIAKLIGDTEFKTMYQQGNQANLFISLLDTQDLLAIVFDERTTIGMIKLKTQHFSQRIAVEIQKMADVSASVRDGSLLSQPEGITSNLD